MARSYSTGSRGANKVRALTSENDPRYAEFSQNAGTPPNPPTTREVLETAGINPDIEPFIEGPLGLSTKEVKDFAGAEIFDSASSIEFTTKSGAKFKVNFDLRFAMTDVEDGEDGEKEPTLVKYSISSFEKVLKWNLDATRNYDEYKPVDEKFNDEILVGNEATIRDAIDAEFQKSMVEAGNYNLAKKVGKLAG